MSMRMFDICSRDPEMLKRAARAKSSEAGRVRVVHPMDHAVGTVTGAAGSDTELFVVAEASGDVVGAVVPTEFVNAVKSNRVGTRADSFVEIIKELNDDPAERERGYSHEWLSNLRTDLYKCDRYGEIVGGPYCSQHQSTCTPV